MGALPDYRDKEDTKPDIRPHIGVIEGGGEGDGKPIGDLSAVPDEDNDEDDGSLQSIDGGGEPAPRKPAAPDDASSLKEKEEASGDRYGPSVLDDTRERLGLGYTGNPDDQPRSQKSLNKMFKSNSKLKKRMAIAAAAGGGAASISILFFLAMLPLKIESFVNMIEGRAAATTEAAVGDMTDNLYTGFIRNSIMPALTNGTCRRTSDPTCVVVANGTNPVSRTYAAWAQNKIQYKLARESGIVISRDNQTKTFRMTMHGQSVGTPAEWEKLRRGEITISQLGGKTATRNEIRKAVMSQTKWYQMYTRFKYAKYLQTRGIKFCLIACNQYDKFTDAKETKLLAGKLWLASRVSGAVGESYGLLLDCIMDSNTCTTKLEPSTDTDNTEPKTKFQRNLDTKLTAYIADGNIEKLSKLVERAKGINDFGLQGYLTQEISGKIAKKLGGEAGELITKELIGKSIPWVGWASLAISLDQFANDAPKLLRGIRYASSAAAAVSLFTVYQTAQSETRSGHVDATELGSLADTLSQDQDMTTHPVYSLYQSSSSSSSSTIADLLSGKVFAATQGSGSTYKCDDGSPVPSGKLICPEEDFTNLGTFGNAAVAVRTNYMNYYYNFWPVRYSKSAVYFVNKVYTWITGLPGRVIAPAMEAACNLTPSCPALRDWATEHAGELFQWVVSHIMPNQWLHMSGARILAMSTAGAEVAYESSNATNNGAGPVSNTAYNDIQNQRIAAEEADFESKSLLGRITNTDTPYSLVSRVALAMPSRSSLAISGLASVLVNPLQCIASVFGSLATSKRAFAAASSTDPFHIAHVAYSRDNAPPGINKDEELDSSGVPKDPSAYWDAHCEGRDFKAEYFKSMKQDPDTDQAVPTHSEPCMLIETSTQVNGCAYDVKLCPEGALNGDSADESQGGLTGDLSWPVDKKWFNQNPGDFYEGHTTISGTFTSPYTKGVADDLSVPTGTPVYSMLDGVVEKTNLCGQGDGMMIKSDVDGGTLHIAYGHGLQPKFKVGDHVSSGQQILSSNGVGCKVSGPHLHIDMALDNKHVCPQDVFYAMASGDTPDFKALTGKAQSNCDRSNYVSK